MFCEANRFGAIFLSLIRGTERSTLTAPCVSNQWQTPKNPITSSPNRDLYQLNTQRTPLPLVIPNAHCSENFISIHSNRTWSAHVCGLRTRKHNVILAFPFLHQWCPSSKSTGIRSNHFPELISLPSGVWNLLGYNIHQLQNTTDTLLSVVHDKMRTFENSCWKKRNAIWSPVRLEVAWACVQWRWMMNGSLSKLSP